MEKANGGFKKLVFIRLVLVMLMSSLMLTFNSVKVEAATNEVSLYSVNPKIDDAGGGYTIFALNAQIKVKNLAYEKKVSIWRKDDRTNEWSESKAKYAHAIDGGYEIWTASPLFYMPYIEYAIKYEVNGVTYWDNNNGQNYKTYKNGKTEGLN